MWINDLERPILSFPMSFISKYHLVGLLLSALRWGGWSGSSDLFKEFWSQKCRKDIEPARGEARASCIDCILTKKVLRLCTYYSSESSWRAESEEQGHSQSPRFPRLVLHSAPLSLQIPNLWMSGFLRSIWSHHELHMARTSICLSLETVSGVFMKWALKSPVSQSTMCLKIGEVLFQDNFVFKQQDQQKMPSGNWWWSYTQVKWNSARPLTERGRCGSNTILFPSSHTDQQ